MQGPARKGASGVAHHRHCLGTDCISSKEGGEAFFVELTRSQAQYSLSSILFAGRESIPIQFEEQDAHDEARALVAIEEGMIANDARRVGRRHLDSVGLRSVGPYLLCPRQSGFEQGVVA